MDLARRLVFSFACAVLAPLAYAAPSDPDLPFWRRVMVAVNASDVEALERLMGDAPAGQPLAGIDGEFVLRLSHLHRKLNDRESKQFLENVVRRALELGADPNAFVAGSRQPAYLLVLKEWSEREKTLARRFLWTARRRAAHFFLCLLDFGMLSPDVRPARKDLVGVPEGTLLQWAVASRAPYLMFTFFLGIDLPRGGVDSENRNLAMLLAEFGSLRMLKDFAAKTSPLEAALAFDFEQKQDGGFSVLDSALAAVAQGRSRAYVTRVIRYLVARGANPDRIDSGKDIAARADDFANFFPEYSVDYEMLARELRYDLPRLRSRYRHFNQALACVMGLSTLKRVR